MSGPVYTTGPLAGQAVTGPTFNLTSDEAALVAMAGRVVCDCITSRVSSPGNTSSVSLAAFREAMVAASGDAERIARVVNAMLAAGCRAAEATRP